MPRKAPSNKVSWLAQESGHNLKFGFAVFGALIGKQKGRNVEIMNSFELVFSVLGGDVIIDRDYYNMKEEQCKFFVLINADIFVIFFNSQTGV